MDRKYKAVFLVVAVVWAAALIYHGVWFFATPELPKWQYMLLGLDAWVFLGFVLLWSGMNAPATD